MINQTAVEWLVEKMQNNIHHTIKIPSDYVEQAKEIEKQQIDNKVIHFAEWLTKKHSYTLMALYEHFEEEYYKETLD